MAEISKQEFELLLIIRELKPFERVEITKDKAGVANTYLVHRSQKIIIT